MGTDAPRSQSTQVGRADAYEITDLRTLRAIAHPTRLEILERLARPATATSLADQIGVPRTRLYRHLHALVDAGLVNIVDTRQVRAITESVYQAVARSFVPGPGLLTSGSMQEIGEAVLTTIFDTTRADIKRRLDSGSLSLDQRDVEPRSFTVGRFAGFLTPEQAASIVERLESLAAEVDEAGEEPQPAEQLYTMQFVFYPSGGSPVW